MTGRRIVSVWLPHFAMERWLALAGRRGSLPPDDLPLVLALPGPHGPVVHATNRAARAAGVQTGARAVDMRALCPGLRIEEADAQGDRAALDLLALWSRRWCPWTAADGTAGLIFDITGSDHLWGGEAAMLIEIETRLSCLGLSTRLAVAPTRGAAWALARFGPVRALCHDPATDLVPLPVAALRLDADTVLLLQRLGLKTVGALAGVPRLSLMRRFVRMDGANPLTQLDRALGRLPEPVAPPDAPPVFRADLRLAEPILDPVNHLPALADDLCQRLTREGRGARRIVLAVYRTDGEVRRIEARTAAPSRDAVHLAGLLAERLEKLDPGFGFDQVSLEAPVTETLAAAQTSLEGRTDAALDLSRLIDRLATRFGAHAVARTLPNPSHIPERAQTRAAPMAPRTAPRVMDRPLRLLDPAEEIRVLYAVPEGPPLQFTWRRQTHRTARQAGPERIAPEWWHDRPGTRLRDYYKIETDKGRRYWLYREGAFEDGRGGAPRWFIHGIFD